MRHLLITVVAVAGLSSYLNALESTPNVPRPSSDWVRTIDGWEPSCVVAPPPPNNAPAAIHPAIVASFQLGSSVFFLLAFPPNVGRPKKTAIASKLDVGSSLLAGV